MILVFASKPVGAAALAFLLERGDPVERVIFAQDTDTAIVKLCDQSGIRCDRWSPDLAAGLAKEGRHYEWLLNLYSPQILPAAVLALAERRVNLHSGPVPACRGNDNAAWIIRSGVAAGVALLEMEPGIDSGAVWAQSPVEAEFPITGGDLNARLKDGLVDLFRQSWPDILAGRLHPTQQVGEAITYTRRHTDMDRVMDEDAVLTLGQAVQWMLAHDFHPGTTAEMTKDGARYGLRLRVEKLE